MIGAQSVTYQTSVPGALDRKNIATLSYTSTTLYGIVQPMEVKESASAIDYTIEKYRFITSPTATAVAAKATDRLVDAQGILYRVYGAKVQPRVNGAPHHVEIFLEKPSGLDV